MNKPRLIAFYLPQFYPTKENDLWWGKGFTEWTNVGRAKPLFKGHNQPRVPADLGYYDLRIPEVREEQVKLAKEAGIEGFCYWHYWFAGKRLLDRVFDEVVKSGKPDYPFCLCWANHSWYQKTWDPNKPDKLLMEQTYPGKEDYEKHFYEMLPAFRDKRYIRVEGKLLYGVFAPMDIPDFEEFRNVWNRLAVENGLPEFFFFGFTVLEDNIKKVKAKGFDAVVFDGVHYSWDSETYVRRLINGLKKRLLKIPRTQSFDDYADIMVNLFRKHKEIVPCLVPNYDHSPRSAARGMVIVDDSPKKWYSFCRRMFSVAKENGDKRNIYFIKAWNEWAEGNYLEPDLKFGKCYIEETRKAVDSVK